MKKNNTAEKTIQEAEKITKALKESTEKSLRDIVSEAISNLVKENCDEEDDNEDDSYEVEDVDTDENSSADETPEKVDGEDADAEGQEIVDDADDAEDDEWSDMDDYKVGDDEYDFTGVNGDEVLKVYNKLGDDDKIFVKKEEDGKYSVKDDETGAEFVIELDPSVEGSDEMNDDSDFDSDDEFDGEDDIELDMDSDEDDMDGEEGNDDIELDLNDEGNMDDDMDDDMDIDVDNSEDGDDVEIDIDDDNDEDELNEDLGYTDSYQKDVFANKFNMNEPANSKSTYSMDGGAPKGSGKPWAGKGNMKPFGQKSNLDENGGTISSIDARHMKKGQLKQHRPNAPEYAVRKEDSPMNESIKKIVAKAKAIQLENKQYEKAISNIKKSLYEAAVLNVNLGKLVDILVNETTTKDEKKAICERFNKVKTIADGKALHESIKSELNESKKSVPSFEKQFVADATKVLNETTIYRNTESDAALDLMSRMDNLFKK